MFSWVFRQVSLLCRWLSHVLCYVGAALCLICMMMVGSSVFQALDSPAGRVVAGSLAAGGKAGAGLFPWWGGVIGIGVVCWLWWTHKIVMSIVIGCIAGLIVALWRLT